MKYVWLSDVHLDHCDEYTTNRLCTKIGKQQADGIIITGDIGVHRDFDQHLEQIHSQTGVEAYFVLGNHDFWGSSYEKTQEKARNTPEGIEYLTGIDPTCIGYGTYLAGCDGFYDGGAGYLDTRFILKDLDLIDELREAYFEGGVENTMMKARKWAQKQSKAMYKPVFDCCQAAQAEIMYIATHVPPFEQSSLYRGKPSEPHAAPWFVNTLLGHTLLELAESFSKTDFRVLCGHTHDKAYYKPLDNLTVYTAAATYRAPAISGIIDTDQQELLL